MDQAGRMSAIIDISGISGVPAARPAGGSASFGEEGRRAATASEVDRIEISDMGRRLSEIAETSTFRAARIRSIRQEIDHGTYETTARIEATAARLLKFLR